MMCLNRLPRVVLRRGAEVQLGDKAGPVALPGLLVQESDGLVPGVVRVPDVVGLVVQHHQPLVAGDPLPQRLAGIQGLARETAGPAHG